MSGGEIKSDSERARALSRRFIQLGLLAGHLWAGSLQAGPISVPNGSFESPSTFFVSLNFDSWQRTRQPTEWDENSSGPWTNLTGIFKNTAPGSADHIDNCTGDQSAWLFANPGVGIFQDYNSVGWNDTVPTHDFDAKFEAGKSYQLTVGLLVGGMSSGGGIPPDATLDFILYYRDAASNRVSVAATTITNSLATFSNSTHLLDFTVKVSRVRLYDPWAGQNIGILLLSTARPELAGGYWDLDNVRLTSILAPTLLNPVRTNGQFQFTLQGEPGLVCEILASTNASLPPSDWVSLGTLTNVTGTIPFIDTSVNFDQRFYQARQLP
jgi:HpiC1 cyclase